MSSVALLRARTSPDNDKIGTRCAEPAVCRGWSHDCGHFWATNTTNITTMLKDIAGAVSHAILCGIHYCRSLYFHVAPVIVIHAVVLSCSHCGKSACPCTGAFRCTEYVACGIVGVAKAVGLPIAFAQLTAASLVKVIKPSHVTC